MKLTQPLLTFLAVALSSGALTTARAEDLFREPQWAHVASDQKAARVGDILTIVVYQNAESRNAARNDAGQHHDIEARARGGSVDEFAELSFGGDYAGRGEVRRSESFVTQLSVSIREVLPNGDYLVAGEQLMNVNGEQTTIRVRGRVRPVDVTSDNQVLSTHLADAQIDYDGDGFVSRNARPGLIHRLFAFLGLGG